MAKNDSAVTRAFEEVRAVFPFPGYMDGALDKYRALIAPIIEQCPPKAKILSIGAGPCDLEAILSKLSYQVTAVDDLQDQWHLIGKNRDRILTFAKQMGIELLVESAGGKVKENSFDAVLLIDVIEHLHESPRGLLNYSISLLKQGGLLLIETPNCAALAKRLKVLSGRSSQVSAGFFYWNIGPYRSHVREYTRQELKQMLEYQNLRHPKIKMLNIILREESGGLLGNAVTAAYKLISGLHPGFKATILASGWKPAGWQPTAASITHFKKYYSHLDRWNLDNETDEVMTGKLMADGGRNG